MHKMVEGEIIEMPPFARDHKARGQHRWLFPHSYGGRNVYDRTGTDWLSAQNSPNPGGEQMAAWANHPAGKGRDRHTNRAALSKGVRGRVSLMGGDRSCFTWEPSAPGQREAGAPR